jgi:hypothetical protein
MSELIRVSLSRDPASRDVHLRACVDAAADEGYLAAADVLHFMRPVSPDVVAAQLARYPGCVVCAGQTGDGTVLLAVRQARVGANCGAGADSDGGLRAELVASLVHALLTWSAGVEVGTVNG